MDTIGTIICILSFASALAAISGSIGYITNKVNKIEMDSKACLEEVKDIHREITGLILSMEKQDIQEKSRRN